VAAAAAVVAGFDVRETVQRTNLEEEGNKSQKQEHEYNWKKKRSKRERARTDKKEKETTHNQPQQYE